MAASWSNENTLYFFIEKRIKPIINQKSKEYIVAIHPRNGFYEEPPLSREDLKGLADFIYQTLEKTDEPNDRTSSQLYLR